MKKRVMISMAISLEKFIEQNKGQILSNPPGSKGSYTGQCVSLVQQYLDQCYDIPFKSMGNAKDWAYLAPLRLLNDGSSLGYLTNSPQTGDIVIWDAPYGAGYGHIGIYINKTTVFDQNNMSHDGGKAGFGSFFGKNIAKYLRINKPQIFDNEETPPEPITYNSATFQMWDQKMKYQIYNVVEGETLESIARAMGYGDDWQMIYDFHNDLAVKGVESVRFIENPHWIDIGEKLLLPIFLNE